MPSKVSSPVPGQPAVQPTTVTGPQPTASQATQPRASARLNADPHLPAPLGHKAGTPPRSAVRLTRPATALAPVVTAAQAQGQTHAQGQALTAAGARPSEFTAQMLVAAKSDLFNAVNGEWARKETVRPDKSAAGTFADLADRANQRLRSLIENASPSEPGSDEQKIRQFHASYLDTAAIDRAGLASIHPFLDQIDQVKDKHQLARLLGDLQGVGPLKGVGTPESGCSMLMKVQIEPDPHQPDTYLAAIHQSGLGMPNKDYYLSEDASAAGKRGQYVQYLKGLFTEARHPDPEASANAVFHFEKQLAALQWSNADNRDAEKKYNLVDVSQLSQQHGEVDWKTFLQASGLPADLKRVSLHQPDYIAGMAKLLDDLPTVQLYMKARLLDDAAAVLPKAIRDLNFEFHGRAMAGQPDEAPRADKSMALLNFAFGDGLGKMYAEQHVSAKSKQMVEGMADTIKKTFGESLKQTRWMEPKTAGEPNAQASALKKLAACDVHVGYPEKFGNYQALQIKEGDAAGNWARAGRFLHDSQTRLLNQKVDRSEWLDPPQIPNAYYDEDRNQAWILGAIMEPPLFDPAAHPAQNFAGIGVVLAHELSHAFDDKGSLHDETGKLHDEWSSGQRATFQKLGDKLKAFGDQHTVEVAQGKTTRQLKMDGELTLGESLADLRGLAVALQAYQAHMKAHPQPKDAQFTDLQLFFLNWSRGWRQKMRPDAIEENLKNNPHPPAQYRVNLARHLPEFYEAFDVKPGDKMYLPPEARVRLTGDAP